MPLALNPNPGDEWLSNISAPISATPARPAPTPQAPQPSSSSSTITDISAGLGAAKLATGAAGAAGADVGAVKAGLGGAGNVLGIYSGLEQGTTGGYLGAAANAAQLGSKLGSNVAGEVAGPLVAAAAIYNFAESWQSGSTGSDALSGAEAGAAIGTTIVPGIGTVVGAVIGGAVGALSSAFGGGATDPETKNWQSFINATGGANATPAQVAKYQNLSPQSAFNLLAGVMDIRDNRIPIVNAFGRMGESTLMNGMFAQINSAYQAGQIKPGSTPQQVYSQVVTPWLNSKGATIGPETGGLQLQTVLTSLIGSWQNGKLTANTPLTSSGSKDATIPAYAGMTAAQSPLGQSTASTVSSQLLNFGTTGSSGSSLSATLPLLLTIPGALGGSQGASMPSPTNTGTQPQPMSTATQGMPTDPLSGAGPAAAPGGIDAAQPTQATDPSFLSTLGTDFSNFINSPAGNLAEFGTLAGLGLSQANQQKSENQALAGSIATPGQPYTAAGAAELGQLTGGPQMGGPMGAAVAQQTGAAANLGEIAKQYSTGNLTADQNTQVKQFVAEQKAQAASELAARGITDPNSDQYIQRMQQIDDNAASLSQQLTQQNLSIAEGALTSVQQTYSGLLNQALTSSEFGLGAQEQAVTLQIQSDTALAGQLQQLFSGIAQGFGNAMRPAGGGAGGGAGGVRAPTPGVASQGGGGVASTAAGGGTSPQTLRETGGANSGIAAGGPTADQQAVYDQNQQGFLDTTQQQIDQTTAGGQDYLESQSPLIDPSAPIDFSADPLSNLTSDPFAAVGG